MANEKIVNRENLKAFRQEYDKRLLNGTLVPTKSLQAQSIQAVSTESGAVQDTPFIYQGTGTANGADVVDTSPFGKHLEKQGNTVVVNQQLQNGNFASDSGWTANSSTLSVANNVATISSTTSASAGIRHNISLVSNHKYLVIATLKANVNTTNTQFALYNGTTYRYSDNVSLTANSIKTALLVIDFSFTATTTNMLYFYANATSGSLGENGTIEISNVSVIDLTQWFNGDIPQDLLDNPSNFYRYYNGSLAYNVGSLENSDGQYLECGGRNVWDEVAESGGINNQTGENATSSSRFRSKNFISIIPNTNYYCCKSTSDNSKVYVYFYNSNKEYLGYDTFPTDGVKNSIFATPTNAYFMKLACDSGTTYNHDITISLYYATGDGYDQYYPYVAPKRYDTGNEVLRKAGSVKDTKAPDGTITRRVGYVDLGSLTWTKENGHFYSQTISDAYTIAQNSYIANITCGKYTPISYATAILDTTQGIALNNSKRLYVYDVSLASGDATAFKNAISGVYLFYELATPTTEQGTPFSDLIEINDYGTMAWKDSNNEYVEIPQGCKIFYPADYVLFIDSVGQREDIKWDATKLVSESQLGTVDSAYKAVDSQLLNAIGGTLRQCLCVKESLDFDNTAFVDLGSLNWGYDSGATNPNFYSTSLQTLIKSPNANSQVFTGLCSNYSSITRDNVVAGTKGIACATNGIISIRDTTYTDTTAFQNAMKGVLLAYEKA